MIYLKMNGDDDETWNNGEYVVDDDGYESDSSYEKHKDKYYKV